MYHSKRRKPHQQQKEQRRPSSTPSKMPDKDPCRANWHLLSDRKKKLIINISEGNVYQVEHLLIKDDMKYPIYEGKGAMIVAASNTNENVKEMFKYLSEGFPERDRDGTTPLHYCAANFNLVAMKAYLELNPFSHSQQSYDGSSPLGLCAQHGNLEGVKLLLKYGADPNAEGCNKATPLILACLGGHLETMEYLLTECNVAIEAVDADGRTPLQAASIGNHTEICTMLLDRGVNVDGMARDGKTALIIACMYGWRKLAKMYIREFCDTELSTKNGKTAIVFAAENGHAKVVKDLLNNGANPNPDLEDGSPLLYACQEGHLAAAKVLAQHQLVDVRWYDQKKRCAFSMAGANCHYHVLRMLVKQGAKGCQKKLWYQIIDRMQDTGSSLEIVEKEYKEKIEQLKLEKEKRRIEQVEEKRRKRKMEVLAAAEEK